MATTTATFAGCSSRAGHCFRRVPVIGSCVPRATSCHSHSRRSLLPARGRGKTAGGIRRGRSEAETERPRPALPSAWAGPLAASWRGGAGSVVLEK